MESPNLQISLTDVAEACMRAVIHMHILAIMVEYHHISFATVMLQQSHNFSVSKSLCKIIPSCRKWLNLEMKTKSFS